MLDQFREHAQENMDNFQELSQKMTRSRLIVVLSGTAFALLFFLFMVGIFRKEESNLTYVPEEKPVMEKPVSSLEDRLEEILVRLERLEAQTKTGGIKEESIAMADKALRQFAATQEPVSHIQDDPLSAIIAMAENDTAEEQQEPTQQAATAPIKTVPSNKVEQRIHAPNTKIHIVRKGETLSQISLLYYGTANRWKTIYEANRERISNINNLKVGTKLTIPEPRSSTQ